MKIRLLMVGKTDKGELGRLIDHYISRIKHYAPLELTVIPEPKKKKQQSKKEICLAEGKLILAQLQASEQAILLDEKGKQFSSTAFADYLQKQMNSGFKQLTFIVGGAYGFSDEVYRRVPAKISLSKMTFSHQMVRLFALEQIYRGLTILKGEPYHHE